MTRGAGNRVDTGDATGTGLLPLFEINRKTGRRE
jgi:hypothetical protein